MFLTYIKKYSLIFIVLASLMDSRINLESIKLQYALGLDNHLLLFYFFACQNKSDNIGIAISDAGADHLPLEWEIAFPLKPFKVGKTDTEHGCGFGLVNQFRNYRRQRSSFVSQMFELSDDFPVFRNRNQIGFSQWMK